MSWTRAQLASAISELRDDPESRGYSSMTNQQVADDMALEIWQTPPATVDVRAGSVAARIPLAEMTAWRTSTNADVVTSWHVFEDILSSDGCIRGDRLLEQSAAFGPGGLLQEPIFSANSVAAVQALVPVVNRWQFLGLPEMHASHVAFIRSKIGG